ncbi:MAG: 4Fe-4S binding protein [Candidatus Thermoplasmatota archaeon]|jgi:Fe-S-cluster-containing hydrogenase component 2|nr:4Fe-4S binding protein [Candidatus Thermoplasmatota archaeon]
MKVYEKTGVLSLSDLRLPSKKQLEKGVAILECVQEIPCNPCVDTCPVNAISMKDINAVPVNDYDKCTGCGKCVGVCPGLAIFVVKIKDGKALITLPYEFLPVPVVGENVHVLDRTGKKRGFGLVKRVVKNGKTMVVTVEVDEKLGMDVRNIRVER